MTPTPEAWIQIDTRRCRSNPSWLRYRLALRNRLFLLRKALRDGDRQRIHAALDAITDKAGDIWPYLSHAQLRLLDRISLRTC